MVPKPKQWLDMMGRNVENKNLILERKIKASQIQWGCKTWYNKILLQNINVLWKPGRINPRKVKKRKGGQQEEGREERKRKRQRRDERRKYSSAQQRCRSSPTQMALKPRCVIVSENKACWHTVLYFPSTQVLRGKLRSSLGRGHEVAQKSNKEN